MVEFSVARHHPFAHWARKGQASNHNLTLHLAGEDAPVGL